MTARSTTIGTLRDRATFAHLRRLARRAGSILAAISSRWSDIVEGGQLGPAADTVTSRNTGARI